MLTGIRHTAVLVLGCVLLAVVMACGDTQPPALTIEPTSTPDIEATVEAKVEERLRIEATVVARIEEKQAEDAALEAKAQAMAKAMVEATAQSAGSPVRALSRLASTAHGLPRTAGPGRTGTVGGQA